MNIEHNRIFLDSSLRFGMTKLCFDALCHSDDCKEEESQKLIFLFLRFLPSVRNDKTLFCYR